jgi:hypothetical protein
MSNNNNILKDDDPRNSPLVWWPNSTWGMSRIQ